MSNVDTNIANNDTLNYEKLAAFYEKTGLNQDLINDAIERELELSGAFG